MVRTRKAAVEGKEVHPLSNGFTETGKKRRVVAQKYETEADELDEGQMSLESNEEDELGEQRLKYEEERNRTLQENRKRMEELGLAQLKSTVEAKKKRSYVKFTIEAGFLPRRSLRHTNRKRLTEHVSQRKDESRPPEFYTEKHIKLLGSCTNDWERFRDGCHNGRKICDRKNGKTCHQCRAKTVGQKTSCSLCRAGHYCGNCLFVRYGENVLEAKANVKWVCPVCRGICNCSLCRKKRGWASIRNVYRQALAQGFRSVAHYLIMTRQRRPGCEEDHEGKESIARRAHRRRRSTE